MMNNNVKWWEKFSPTIMEAEVPQKFIDIINNTGDEVLKDDGLSKKYDFSDNLVGKNGIFLEIKSTFFLSSKSVGRNLVPSFSITINVSLLYFLAAS